VLAVRPTIDLPKPVEDMGQKVRDDPLAGVIRDDSHRRPHAFQSHLDAPASQSCALISSVSMIPLTSLPQSSRRQVETNELLKRVL
jgi:hypothetical protein